MTEGSGALNEGGLTTFAPVVAVRHSLTIEGKAATMLSV